MTLLKNLKLLFIFTFLTHALNANEIQRCPALAQAMRYKNISKALTLRHNKTCPVLSRLVTWKALSQQQNTMVFHDYYEFVKHNSSWPWLYEIRLNGEKSLKKISESMPASERVHLCKTFFKEGLPYTVSGLKYYVKALEETHQSHQAHDIVRKFWHKRILNEEDTKKFLVKFALYVSAKDHNQRLTHLLNNNELKTISLILPYIEKSDAALKCLHLLMTDPDKGMSIYENLPLKTRLRPALANIYLRKLAVRNNDQAAQYIINNNMIVTQDYDHNEKTIIKIVRQLLDDKNYLEVVQIMKLVPDVPDHKYFLIGLAYFLHHDYQQAAHAMSEGYLLQKSGVSQAQYAYWSGLSYALAAQTEQASIWWHKAALQPHTYYGQKAYEKLGLNPDDHVLAFKKLHYTSQDMKVIESNSLIEAIKYLAELKVLADIPAFIYTLRHQLKTIGLKHAALEWIGSTVPAMICELARIIDCIYDYKVTYPQLYNSYLDSSTAPVSLSLSIIRRESNFYPNALSPAGALGLMQIMLPTAHNICQELNCTPSKQKLLNEPEFNLKLGQNYLEQLLKKYDGSYVLTAAAYNAGYGNVNKWIKRFGDPRTDIEPEVFIELIPFRETRIYVKQIVEVAKVYQMLLK